MPSKKLPDSVIHLLKSSSFLHLATCLNNVPHVSLMNYTYIHHGDNDYIIISTPINTTKYENMLSNPNVSLLAHDWISLKSEDKKQDQAPSRRNSLYELLANINKNELNRVSVMLNGKAEIIGREDQKFDFFNGLHLNNPKIEESQVKNYIECEHNALVVIKIDTCKVTDTELLRPEQNEQLKALVRAINYLLLLSFTILAIFIVIINSSGAFNKTEQKTYNDRLLVLDKGQVAEFDTPENLLKNKEGISL